MDGLNCNAGNLATLFRALSASFSASPAMIHVQGMFLTFLGTGIANFRTHPADFMREFGTSTHIRGGAPADLRTIGIQSNALGERIRLRFAQARATAVFALLCTTDTGIDTGSKLFVGHGYTSQ